MEDHTRLHWLDERHLMNSEVNDGKVRCDPLTGIPKAIVISGKAALQFFIGQECGNADFLSSSSNI